MEKTVDVPEKAVVEVQGSELVVKGPRGELRREFRKPNIKLAVQGGKVVFSSELEKKSVKAIIGTWVALVRNMLAGVTKGWSCRMRLVYSHFPVKLKVEGDRLIIENFLGERKAREARILDGTETKVEKDEIVVTGIDRERVGQTCANIEQTCVVKGYDRRVFQDGIWKLGKSETVEEEK